ncbi:MAG TPA: riboflavin biosynthesis protein RibF [Candidatus Baltobacteraceae bacterium]
MKISTKLAREVDRPLSLTIGFFDGMHRGHRELARQTRRLRRPGWRSGVLTFSNHPAEFLRPGTAPPMLHTPEERLRALDDAGFEECFFVPFDDAIASLTPERFMQEVLIDALGTRAVVTGATFRFGHKRAGDASTMAVYLGARGVAYVPLENLADHGERISSTHIRALVAAGELDRADDLLGRSYELRGTVERGEGRGHGLGFPTANVRPPQKLLPKDGVYSAVARFDGCDRAALVSIGTNPQFGGGARTIEAWLRDFHATIYGCELALRDLRFVREQRTFDNVDDLIRQMKEDTNAVAYPAFG